MLGNKSVMLSLAVLALAFASAVSAQNYQRLSQYEVAGPSPTEATAEGTMPSPTLFAPLRQSDRKRLLMEAKEEFQNRLEIKVREKEANMVKTREEFQNQLSEFKNKQKQMVLARIEKNLNSLNERFVEHMQERIERLEEILSKLEERLNKIKEEGGETTDAEALLEAVRTSMDSLKAAVEEQAAKVYTPVLMAEETVGSEMKEIHRTIAADFKVIRDMVLTVRRQMLDLLKALKETTRPTVTITPETDNESN